MSLTITISGIYLDPEGMVLPDKTLSFESLYNSSQTQLKTTVKVTTDEYGSYSVALVPNYYSVCEADDKGRTKWLGNIQIFADSPPGTLNEYLTAFKTDQVQPGILAEMEEILEETKQAAENAGFVPRGPWSATENYEKNDLVQYAGSQYLATADVSGIEPPAQPWQLFVSKGQDGPANELTIGTVDTLPAGSAATAEITGEAPEQTLNLGLPTGKQGDAGPANKLAIGAVETLPAGSQATASVTGEYPDQQLNLGLPAGKEGEPGPANELTIGTVETLPAGSPATASITGTYPDQKLNLGIPEGEPGSSLVIPEFEGPGFIGFFAVSTSSATTFLHPGDEVAASVIAYSGVSDPANYMLQSTGGPAGGTWRCLGFAAYQGQPTGKAAMPFQRVDVASYLRGGIEFSIKNCRYSKPDNSMIDCEIIVNGKKRPFSASASDVTPWGREIFNNALAGEYGAISEYVSQDLLLNS